MVKRSGAQVDFFHSQENLTSIQWILRAIVSFSFLLLATKLMGRRSIAQLRLLDFTIALILGNILAHPLSDEQLGLKGSIITTGVLIALYLLSVLVSLKWRRISKWFEPTPFPLIRNGEILYKELGKARITIDHLLSEARKAKVTEINKVAFAMWEPDGTISFFLSPQLQALTPEDIQLVKKPFFIPRTIIKEGKIDFSELRHLGKDIAWLENKMSVLDVRTKEILLATMDDQEQLNIFLYE
nr:YetF domain-containing protein [Sporosarcina aquimarina]